MTENFGLGETKISYQVWNLMEQSEAFSDFVSLCTSRFINHDWGIVNADDKELNDKFARRGHGRMLAAYWLPAFVDAGDDRELWIISDRDKMVTTILFPMEYKDLMR